MKPSSVNQAPNAHYISTPNQFVNVAGTTFAFRDLGRQEGVPLMLLNHWGAVLDNFDPAIVDGLASQHRIIAIDFRGIGGSHGSPPVTIAEMARDTIELMRALGFDRVDLMGFSMGGFVAQDMVLRAPSLVRKLILTGTGPAGGKGIDQVGAVFWPLMLKGLLTLRDPKFYLFFTQTANGRQAAGDFLKRLKQRKKARDKAASPGALLRQLKAIKSWGRQTPQALENINIPVLIVNGDNDRMVPTVLSREMAQRIPHAQLIIYPDAGHGSVFQYHADFVPKALAFLAD